jgi:pimeloyl-ACP methyl ester carboxylesterase
MPTLAVNGAELYFELRGDGPPLLFVMGATGDGGHFEHLAALLADEFAVVTYDRRGYGRSPRPAGWSTTSLEAQADDAAALLEALGLAPAAVFGTSSGGLFALSLTMRDPDRVHGMILHEPALWAWFGDTQAVRNELSGVVREGLDSGGPPAAMERFIRFVTGDAVWDGLEPDLRRRVLESAATYFDVEIGKFDSFMPSDEALRGLTLPVQLLVCDQSHSFFSEAADRLAERLGIAVTRVPGTHFSYHDHPRELAETMRPFLREIFAS